MKPAPGWLAVVGLLALAAALAPPADDPPGLLMGDHPPGACRACDAWRAAEAAAAGRPRSRRP